MKSPAKIKSFCRCCKKEYEHYRSRRKLFCSSACAVVFQVGPNAPTWKGGIKEKECVICGTTYARRGKRCCSMKCAGIWRAGFQRGAQNPFWKGGRTNSGEYVVVLDPRHNRKDGKGSAYIREHRLVMEMQLGRKLWPWELVHHKNGIKDDNREENLEIVTHSTHSGQILCPSCHYTFQLH